MRYVLLVLLLPFLIPLILLVGFWHIGRAIVLHTLLLAFWAPHGRRVLFVYSHSPSWKEYCEREIVSQLPKTAIVRNWSERSHWPRRSLATTLFGAYSGHREFNPIGIVFRPFKPMRIFRFWKPFREAKHGKPHNLERVTLEFLEEVRGRGEAFFIEEAPAAARRLTHRGAARLRDRSSRPYSARRASRLRQRDRSALRPR